MHRLCRPCQRHSSRTTSWPSSVCRRHRIPCTSRLIQQTPRRTECSPHASRSRRCRQGSEHKCRRSQQSPPHSLGTSAHPPWARTQQHTGCTLRSRWPIQAHTAGTQSCLRSAQCRRRTQRKCRPIRRNHHRSSHMTALSHQAPCQAHTPRTHHPCRHIPPRTAGTACGPQSAPPQHRTDRTVRLCRRRQLRKQRKTSSARSAQSRPHTPCKCHPSRLTQCRTAHTTRGSQ